MYFDIDAHWECFKTNENEAFFWHGKTTDEDTGIRHGGQNDAMEIASEHNGKTLEMCMLDHREDLGQAGVEFYERSNGQVSIRYGENDEEESKFWEDCSKAYAEQASGDIHVIEGSDLRQNGQTEQEYPSVYNRIEHPALAENPNVNSITHIDPCSREVTGVENFNRQQESVKNSQTDETNYNNLNIQSWDTRGPPANNEDMSCLYDPSIGVSKDPAPLQNNEDMSWLSDRSNGVGKDSNPNQANEDMSGLYADAGGASNTDNFDLGNPISGKDYGASL